MKVRYCSATHDPQPTKTTLATHDRSHSRRRGAAAKSKGDQSKKERVMEMTKWKSTKEAKNEAEEEAAA